MEYLRNCSLLLFIEEINGFHGGDSPFVISFHAKDSQYYQLVFEKVWDARYSVENGYIDRFCQFRKKLLPDLIENSIYIVENSKYIKYFEFEASGTLPIKGLKDYIITDSIDTVIEVLSACDPELIALGSTKPVSVS